MKTILVTGCAGFIGSNYIRNKLAKKKNIQIVNIDALTYAGNRHNIENLDNRHIFIKGNICDSDLLNEIFNKYDIETVINFAAESHVDRSILDPGSFVRTNVSGTQCLLNACKKHWNLATNKNTFEYKKNVKYLQISTDEVYGTLGKTGKFTETSPIAPNSPYSASKASADLLVRAYNHTYNLPTLITRCSNNYGPYQFPEKLIPLAIKNIFLGKKVPIYGNGLQIRDWIYVLDHCDGIDTVLHKGKIGEVYNIGCENEWTNIDLVKCIINQLDKSEDLIEHVSDRLGHDVRYAIDNHKIQTELGWKPKINFEKGIKLTIDWYCDNREWMNNIETGEYLHNRTG